MLLAKKVTGAFPDMPALRKLYISAFPAKERDPLTELLLWQASTSTQL